METSSCWKYGKMYFCVLFFNLFFLPLLKIDVRAQFAVCVADRVRPKSHTNIVTNELWKEFMAFFYIIVSCILNIDCTCNATTITIRTAAAVVVIVDVHSGNTQTPKHVWFIQQGWNIHIHRWSVLYWCCLHFIMHLFTNLWMESERENRTWSDEYERKSDWEKNEGK